MRPFNTGDCLIEVTIWTGLTVNVLINHPNDQQFSNGVIIFWILNLRLG